MMGFVRPLIGATAACIALSGMPAIQTATAETLVGSNIDNRILVAFRVPQDPVQGFLPDGWQGIAFPKGAVKGANFLLALNDKLLVLDADGKPATPPKAREAALMTLAKNGDTVRLFVLRVYVSDPAYDPFLNAVRADVRRVSQAQGAANAGRDRSETWTIVPETGGELTVSMDFTTGAGAWVSETARPYSNKDPDLSRIFTYDRIVDLVMSEPLGKPLSGNLTVTSDIPELDGILDGSEELVTILNIPVYVREVLVP